jgi:hypothetical protein
MSTAFSSLVAERSTSTESSAPILTVFEKMSRVDEQDVHGKRPSCCQDGSTKHTNPPFRLVSAVSGLSSRFLPTENDVIDICMLQSRLLVCIRVQCMAPCPSKRCNIQD